MPIIVMGPEEWIKTEMKDFHGKYKWLFRLLSWVKRPFTYADYYLFIQRLNEPFIGRKKSQAFAVNEMKKQYEFNNGKN